MDILIAVILDFILGDPYNWPHPVKLMGKIISLEERLVRRITASEKGLRLGGFFIVLFNITLVFFLPWGLLRLLRNNFYAWHALNIYLLYTCLAARCLRDEGYKIYRALEKGLDEARHRLSFIVGRDTKELTEGEVIRAAVETVAENTSDGVIAPLFFAIIGGAPGAMLYKIVNTMDSMLGYMNEKYRHIGFFPAKTDDIFNFIPARMTGILMNLSSLLRFDALRGFKVMIRDRKNHKSPNCAYPEGAAAGLLGVQLGGDNSYFGEIVRKPRIGDSLRQLEREDIRRAIEIMFRVEILMVALYYVIRGAF